MFIDFRQYEWAVKVLLLGLLCIPFGIWKVIELIIWAVSHVSVSIQ